MFFPSSWCFFFFSTNATYTPENTVTSHCQRRASKDKSFSKILQSEKKKKSYFLVFFFIFFLQILSESNLLTILQVTAFHCPVTCSLSTACINAQTRSDPVYYHLKACEYCVFYKQRYLSESAAFLLCSSSAFLERWTPPHIWAFKRGKQRALCGTSQTGKLARMFVLRRVQMSGMWVFG